MAANRREEGITEGGRCDTALFQPPTPSGGSFFFFRR